MSKRTPPYWQNIELGGTVGSALPEDETELIDIYITRDITTKKLPG